MKPEQRAAVAAALLDTLPAEQVLAERLERLTELVTEAGQAGMTRDVYAGLNQLHKALAAIAAQAAAEELAEAGPQLHAVADQPMTDEQYADMKWRQAHPGAVGS